MARKKAGEFARIVFPTDLSALSAKTVMFAVSLAKRYKAKLYVIHVVETLKDGAGLYVPHLSFDKMHKDMNKSAAEMLKKFCIKEVQRGFRNCECALLKGDPYKEIIKFSEKKKADLIVMGTLSKTRVDRLIFGSTTERVMRKSKCPVMMVPPTR